MTVKVVDVKDIKCRNFGTCWMSLRTDDEPLCDEGPCAKYVYRLIKELEYDVRTDEGN